MCSAPPAASFPPSRSKSPLAAPFAGTGVGTLTWAGLATAWGVTRFLANMLYGVKASDPATFAAVAAIVALAALSASSIPALRAASIDPSRALRHE